MAGVDELNAAQQQALRLGEALLAHPEVRTDVQRLYKKVKPDAVIPELALEERIDKVREEGDKKLEKFEQQLMEERVARRKAERDAMISKAGFTVEEIEKIMVDRKCTVETAIHIAGLERQTAEPSSPEVRTSTVQGEPLDMRPDKDWKNLSKKQAERKGLSLAHTMVDEFRREQRRTAR
jgi:hypothetical protein